MISAFRAQGEHTTGTARAGAWQRTRGPFAIDIPEAAGAGVCLLLPCPRLRGARAGIQAAACPRQVLLLPRVQEEKGSFAAKERYHPLGAQLSSAQGKVRRGKGEEKQRDQEEFQLQIPARIFSGFLVVSCAFHTPQLCGMSCLPSLCPVPVSLWISILLTGSKPQGLLSVVWRTVNYLEEEQGSILLLFPRGKLCVLQSFVSAEGFAGSRCLAEQQLLLGQVRCPQRSSGVPALTSCPVPSGVRAAPGRDHGLRAEIRAAPGAHPGAEKRRVHPGAWSE